MVLKRTKQNQISFGCESVSQMVGTYVRLPFSPDCDTATGQRVYPAPPMAEADLLPEQIPPAQAEPPLDDGDMGIRLTSWPPLGRSTSFPAKPDDVQFTVLLEQTQGKLDQPPDVVLRHNFNGPSHWRETPFKIASQPPNAVYFEPTGDNGASKTRHWYTVTIPWPLEPKHAVSFTLKYGISDSAFWRWVKDTTGVPDGTLHYSRLLVHGTDDLSLFITGMSSDIKVENVESETSDTHLWSLTCPIEAAKGKDSGYQQHRLGRIVDGMKWFALVRLWSPWLAPRQGSAQKFELDKDGVLLSFMRADGMHVVCLAISGVKDILTTFIHDSDGNVEIKGRNDREEVGEAKVLVAVANDFERANCAVMYQARKVISQYSSTSQELAESTKQIKALTDEKVRPEWLEEWYDGLTYCTWNGLGQNLTADKIHTALDELTKRGINVTNLIIDDNWQSLSQGETQFNRGWSRFEANSSGFPDGMKALTKSLREEHKNLRRIAVWHAILGYWGGIDPDGEIAKTYKTRKVMKQSGVASGEFTVVDPEDVQRMYDDFYAFLASVGIDSVKTDAQFFLDLLQDAPDRRQMMLEYQDAWTLAHLRHFSSRAISCMSHFPQAIFHTQLPQNKPRLLVRNSDDFFPDVEASHAWHIFCNAHNSVLTQHLNALPDWDMFQTSHKWAAFHAAARCVSGGPIYFTDKPGEHDIKLIRQMTAQAPTYDDINRTVILRPHRIGRTTDVYTPYDSPAILKIATFVNIAGSGAGILGCFNVSNQALTEFMTLGEFPGTDKGEGKGEYIVSSFSSPGEVSPPIAITKGSEGTLLHMKLEIGGWDILTAYPIHPYTIKDTQVKIGIMGLIDKMTGIAAVSSSDINIESRSNEYKGRFKVYVQLKALGTLGIWISDLAHRSVEEAFLIVINRKVIPEHCVKRTLVEGREDGVLEVDVERAWTEMGLGTGWGNEVGVYVFIG